MLYFLGEEPLGRCLGGTAKPPNEKGHYSIKSNNHLRFIQHRMESIESWKRLSNTELTELSIEFRGNLNETKEACRET